MEQILLMLRLERQTAKQERQQAAQTANAPGVLTQQQQYLAQLQGTAAAAQPSPAARKIAVQDPQPSSAKDSGMPERGCVTFVHAT